jgi:hypothetical protein
MTLLLIKEYETIFMAAFNGLTRIFNWEDLDTFLGKLGIRVHP